MWTEKDVTVGGLELEGINSVVYDSNSLVVCFQSIVSPLFSFLQG